MERARRITIYWCGEMPESEVRELTDEDIMNWEEQAVQYKTFIHSPFHADVIVDSAEELRDVIHRFRKAVEKEGEDIVVAAGAIGYHEKIAGEWETLEFRDVGSYKDIIDVLEKDLAERWLG